MRTGRQRTVQVLGIIFFFAVVGTAHAESCEKSVGRLVSLQGTVEARPSNQTVWQPAKLNDKFCPGDAIRTGARSRAGMMLANETIVRLDQLTTLTLSGVDDKSTSWVDLLSGMAHFLSRTPRSLKVKTPYINAGVEGTEFVVRAGASEGSVSVLEGRVLAENAQGSTSLVSGELAAATAGQAPVKRLVVQIRDAVQWSLYYPPLFEGSALVGNESWVEAARRSATAYFAGDSAAAFAAIASVPNSVSDARFFNYRAGLLLSVGRVDEAQTDINRSLQLRADNAHALALQSVVALVRNDHSTALDLARKANTRDSMSVPAWVALSYAQQAAFDIDAALASMQQAVLNDPNNALAWSRLAELWLALGNLEQAQKAADRAVAINPNIARTQTVRGFAALTRIKTANAQRAFEMAISQDSADPLARLGLGLARIRQGDLEDGRRDIEIAAALDPNNALIRSYLGKAYYEEKRNRLATTQLDMAKQLDPKDPTPWFYDAIRKQTENRPGDALHDLKKSIELNDNRAIFRSRLSLDQDLAARNVSLGRVYQDVGFGAEALEEGWASVHLDPRNFSAHRLLADSYAVLPRHEIARVSELLQFQMLQPLNLSPLQPQQTQTDLPLFPGSVSADTGFRDYTPLFTRDGLHVQFNGLFGSNHTLGDDMVISGISNRISYSIGQAHYESQGFRPNNDLTQNIHSAFIQTQLSEDSSFQLELRRQDRRNGDLALLFDPNVFSQFNRERRTEEIARIGYHYAPSHSSDLLFSVISNKTKLNQNISEVVGELFPGAPITRDEQTTDLANGYTTEFQFLTHANYLSYVAGIGHYWQDGDRTGYVVESALGAPLFEESLLSYNKTKHSNAYIYTYLHPLRSARFTLGLSADNFDYSSGLAKLDEEQVNPKLGIMWRILPDTNIRLAGFRSLKRSLASNQTVEPTQVAGFNQLFDDPTGTDSTRYGVGLDQVVSTHVTVGIEFTRRKLNVPVINSTTGTTLDDEQRERADRLYLHWLMTKRLGIAAEYFSERFERDFPSTDLRSPSQLSTKWAPIMLTYFQPNGLFGKVRTSFVTQEIDSSSAGQAEDSFWICDLSLGYRLPRRYGVVSIDAKNLFNKEFRFHDVDFQNGTIPRVLFQPERTIFLRFGLAL